MLNHKLILFGGKGGVGKTSCAAAAALHAAHTKKTLLISTDPAHSLSDSFEKSIGKSIKKIKKNLDVIELDSNTLLHEFKKEYSSIIKQIVGEGTFFSKNEINNFFDLSLPGMDEVMALLYVIHMLKRNEYDIIMLDTAPTGHTIRLLEMPEVMMTYMRVLDGMRKKHRVMMRMVARRYVQDKADLFIASMQEDMQNIAALLKSSQTVFVPVVIPEAMAVQETKRLLNILNKYNIPVGTIFINKVMHNNCDFCKKKRKEQLKYVRQIEKLGSTKSIPLFPVELKGKYIQQLANIMFNKEYVLPEPKKLTIPACSCTSLKIPLQKTFVLFGGKGGVGKTTMAAAAALHLSKERKVLLFSTDPAHSLSDSFEKKIGKNITTIQKNLDVLEIDAYKVLDDLKNQYKKEINNFFSSVLASSSKITIDVPYDRKVMEDLIELAPPGIDEIMAIKTIMDILKKNEYDVIVLDTAPTGHTIRLLEMPGFAEKWVATLRDVLESYPLSEGLEDMLDELLASIRLVRKTLVSNKTLFVPVTIPEAMSIAETKDLLRALQGLGVQTRQVVVNNIFPSSSCDFCMTKRAVQYEHVKKLSLSVVCVELKEKEVKGEQLKSIAKELF
jgi:arsenite/tail-anchored protein-transporting ATPase